MASIKERIDNLKNEMFKHQKLVDTIDNDIRTIQHTECPHWETEDSYPYTGNTGSLKLRVTTCLDCGFKSITAENASE